MKIAIPGDEWWTTAADCTGAYAAYRPKVFLMDEPLSNLDARLRMDMRTELKRLHRISGATTIYVTHDQIEAMTMSTNIAIMKEGVIQQNDTPTRFITTRLICLWQILLETRKLT